MIIMKRKTYFAICILLCALSIALCAIFTGCSRSETDSGEPDIPDVPSGVEVPVRITLSALPNNAQTRADEGKPKDPEASVELIHDWWIAFVAPKTGDVKVVTRKQAEDKTSSTSVNIPGGGFEAETFRTTLPAGTYRIYAFANIDTVTAEDFKKNYLKEPKKESDEWKHQDLHLDNFNTLNKSNIASKFINGMQWPSSENIPMSGVMSGTDVVIKNTVEHVFNIEVVRTVAKVEFDFSNPSADNITLENLKFGPISNLPSKISIIPNYKAIGIKANDKLKTDKIEAGTLSFDLKSETLTTNRKHSLSFYCNESLSKDDNDTLSINGNGFEIELSVTRGGDAKKYTYQTKNIKYINRNDWIYIPIKFNDWEIIWKLHYYPPIGGYPPVFKQSGSGNTLTATLTTGGEFELYPEKIKKNSEDADYYNDVDWDKVTISALTDDEKRLFVDGKTPEVIDNPNISTENHPLNGRPKIIAGELKSTEKGKAEIKITFYLNNKDSDNNTIPYAKTKFDCTFTIYRENSSQ